MSRTTALVIASAATALVAGGLAVPAAAAATASSTASDSAVTNVQVAASGNPGFSASFWSPYWFDGNPQIGAQLSSALSAQASVGEKGVIVEWAVHEDAKDSAYPADPALGYSTFNDAIPQIIAAAKKAGTKVWMGLVVGPDMFSDPANFTNQSWLNAQAAIFQKVADDLNATYGSQIAGWYIPTEPTQDNVSTPQRAAQFGGFLGQISDYLHSHDGGKPVMVSPSMPTAALSGVSASTFVSEMAPMVAAAHADVWNLQDGFEMTAWSPAQEAAAFSRAKVLTDTYGSQLWAAVYTPATDGNGVVPVSKLAPYLRAIAATGTPLTQWEFAQYQNPDASRGSAQQAANFTAYRSYLAAPTPSAPSRVTATVQSSTSVLVRWTQASDSRAHVAGYTVSREQGGVWTVLGTTGRTGVYADATTQPGQSYSYRVTAFSDAQTPSAGAVSGSVSTNAFPQSALLGGRYTQTATAGPDTTSYAGGSRLTSGALAGTTNFTDPSWTGVELGANGSVSYTVDLGSTQSVWYLDSRWLTTPSAGIDLPGQVAYALSSDGTSFTPAATVAQNSSAVAAGLGGQVLDYGAYISNTSAHYLRVTVAQPAGGWVFTDQLVAN